MDHYPRKRATSQTEVLFHCLPPLAQLVIAKSCSEELSKNHPFACNHFHPWLRTNQCEFFTPVPGEPSGISGDGARSEPNYFAWIR
jgi:hypothetical protein